MPSKGNRFMNGLPPSKGGCLSRRALLSPEQRIRLLGIPVDQAGMARHYVLSAEDLALVRAKRRVSNRLGARDESMPPASIDWSKRARS
jgi:hypothetical protein